MNINLVAQEQRWEIPVMKALASVRRPSRRTPPPGPGKRERVRGTRSAAPAMDTPDREPHLVEGEGRRWSLPGVRFRAPAAAASLVLLPLVITTTPSMGAEADAQARETVMCHGVEATIVGDRGSNRLIGTNGRDVIVAKGGHDVIVGRGGRDLICGGRGNDLIDGGPGWDRLYGQQHRDYCAGERGEHRLHFGCEVHRPRFGTLADPPAPRSAAVTRTSTVTADTLPPAVAQRGGDAWFSYRDPWCGTGYIDYGSVGITGAYTQPTSYVAVTTVHANWSAKVGQWVDNPDRYLTSTWSIPYDDNFYSINVGQLALPGGGASLHAHLVQWWTGSEWSQPRMYLMTPYVGTIAYTDWCQH